MNAPVRRPRPTLLALMRVYTKIGILGFGGGYAVLSFIRSEVVDGHAWIDAEQFDNVVEMSAFAPGPTTSNVLAAIAYRLQGWKGLVMGTIAALWPSFLLIMLLAVTTRILHNPWLTGALHGIEVAVVGLLIDVVWTLWKDVPKAVVTAILALLSLALTVLGLNPVITIGIAAAIGLLDFLIRRQPLSRGSKPTSEIHHE
ncbi:MAG: chromate transporter [Sulfobacillus thermotolerans]|nr:chromate transporter [Sulfobacillus thermotolerans]